MRRKAKLLTIQDVAAILAVSERTIHNLVKSKKLHAPYKINGRLSRWEPRHIKDYLAQLRSGNG